MMYRTYLYFIIIIIITKIECWPVFKRDPNKVIPPSTGCNLLALICYLMICNVHCALSQAGIVIKLVFIQRNAHYESKKIYSYLSL